MWRLLLKSLFTGVVTTTYPEATPPLPPGTRGRPRLDGLRCAGTGGCVAACPTGAISLHEGPQGRVWELDLGACLFCGVCVAACENEALENSVDFELAAFNRNDLRVPLRVEGTP